MDVFPVLQKLTHMLFCLEIHLVGKNTLYGIDITEVSECKLIYQKY